MKKDEIKDEIEVIAWAAANRSANVYFERWNRTHPADRWWPRRSWEASSDEIDAFVDDFGECESEHIEYFQRAYVRGVREALADHPPEGLSL